MKRFASYLIRYLLLITPTILMLVALVEFFPYTGLARIAALPAIVVMNSLIIVASFAVPHKGLLSAVLKAVLTIFITLWIAIYFYPQEFSPSVMAQTRDAVRAINNFDNITRDDLNANGNIDNPAYVVALYKYRDEIPLDGTYQLYGRENAYFYDYSINSLDEIGSKLIGYHKAIWWYLKTFKLAAVLNINLNLRGSAFRIIDDEGRVEPDLLTYGGYIWMTSFPQRMGI